MWAMVEQLLKDIKAAILGLSVTVNAGDIEIGAVELKDADSVTRVNVAAGPAANALRTTLASDDPAVAALGAITGAAVVTDANGTIQQFLRGIVKLLGTLGIVAKDAGPSWTSVWGVAGVPFNSADQSGGVASVTDAPTAGQKLVIDDLLISVDTDMSVTFKEETSGTILLGPLYFSANNGVQQVTARGKLKLPTADKKLQVITSASGHITVSAGYHSE